MPAVVLLLAVLAALFVRHTIAEPFSIPSASMSPALRVGDIVLVDRRQAGRMPARGAVIVFQTADGTAYVKRVIGLPGDDVRLISGFAVLNDHSPLVADAGTCETDRDDTQPGDRDAARNPAARPLHGG
jgi:signal peptidase I